MQLGRVPNRVFRSLVSGWVGRVCGGARGDSDSPVGQAGGGGDGQTAEDGTSEKLTPCFVCATVGTTSSNALGPLPEIADLSRARPRQHVALAQDFARWRATPRQRRQGGWLDRRIRSNLFPTKYLHRIRTRLGWLPEPDLGLDDRVERHYCVGHN